MRKPVLAGLLVIVLLSSILSGCTSSTKTTDSGDTSRPEGWTEETHSNDVDPDYETVFPEDSVNTISITISPENWESMQQNMTELYGQETINPGQFPAIDGNQPPEGKIRPEGFPDIEGGIIPDRDRTPPDTGNFTPGFLPDNADIQPPQDMPEMQENITDGLPGWADMTSENPEWVTATIEFNGNVWTNVGIRYKGNSSLSASWRCGDLKMPFKLDFDEFEDDYPEIDNQRFYGFKQLSFSNAFNDATYMRDALASDLLADAGLASAETAWYNVILDYGEGTTDLGLYVLTEVIDDTAIERIFGDDSGNIYEGDGRGVSLAANTYSRIQDSFQKENNQDDADWSDIEELFTVLHSDLRTSAPEEWRKQLEDVFDVDAFLNWLSLSAVLEHWDTYGSMTHNFYLYADPETDQLTWISWDHNEILAGGREAGLNPDRVIAGVQPGRTTTFDKEEITDRWPLIRFLLDDPVYYSTYLEYLDEFVNGVYNPDKLETWCEESAELLEPYIPKSDLTAFESSVKSLIDRIIDRYLATSEFLRTEAE